MDNEAIFNMITLLDRKFTTFAQQAGYDFDLEGNATRVGKPSQVAVVADKAVSGRFKPPALEEVAAYFCNDKQLANWQTEAEKFIDFYECKGWKVGKNKMSKWKSAASNWAKRVAEDAKEKAINAPAKRYSFMELASGEYRKDMEAKYSQPQIAAPTNAIDAFALEYEQHKLSSKQAAAFTAEKQNQLARVQDD